MSWLEERKYSWFQSFCIRVLQAGSIPKHVAFIMDGNRRFASKHNIEKIAGHRKGYDQMNEVMHWCNKFGINQVTVYAFSIENFKRSKEEVDGLMSLFGELFSDILDKRDTIMERGMRVRVCGNLKLLPKDLQNLVAQVVLLTRNNKKSSLNVCLAYTSRDEMCQAVNQLAEGVEKGLIEPEDIDETVFEQCLYTAHVDESDLLIRTSGEVRLSDFLLWQCCYSVLCFPKVLWPELSSWHICMAVLSYQLNREIPNACRQLAMEESKRSKDESDWRTALTEFKSKNSSTVLDEHLTNKHFAEFMKCKEERISEFLKYLKEKRMQELKDMISD